MRKVTVNMLLISIKHIYDNCAIKGTHILGHSHNPFDYRSSQSHKCTGFHQTLGT